MKGVATAAPFFFPSRYMVQLITPRVPAMAVSMVIRILRTSFQLIFMVFGLKVNVERLKVNGLRMVIFNFQFLILQLLSPAARSGEGKHSRHCLARDALVLDAQ